MTLSLPPLIPAKAALEISINPEINFQKIEGFGASIIGWSSQMIPLYSDPDMLDFIVNDLGLSMFRKQVWPRVSETPVENWEDISYEDFVWTGPGNRGRVNNDFAKAILQRNPEIKIIGSIWSPPAWMKENNRITGTASGFLNSPNRQHDHDNRLDDNYLTHYVKFLVEYQKYLKKEGIGLYAFGAQNEPMFTQSFESAFVTGEEYGRLIKALGEMYEQEGVKKPLFFGPEDMTLAYYEPDNPNGRHTPYVESLMHPDVAPYFDIWATHGYTDGVQAGSSMDPGRYWESIKEFNRPYWITEGGTGGHDWPTPITNGVGAHIHHALVGGNVSAFVSWQITENQPNTHGLMVMKEPTKKTFATMHFWRFIRPGSVRISAEPSEQEIRTSAFFDPRKQRITITAINPTSSPRTIHLNIAQSFPTSQFERYRTSETLNCHLIDPLPLTDGVASDMLPAFSITTYLATLEGWEQDAEWGTVQTIDQQWKEHFTLGRIFKEPNQWLYSEFLGWQFPAHGTFNRGIFLYNPNTGWHYTSKTHQPWIYNFQSQSWIEFTSTISQP